MKCCRSGETVLLSRQTSAWREFMGEESRAEPLASPARSVPPGRQLSGQPRVWTGRDAAGHGRKAPDLPPVSGAGLQAGTPLRTGDSMRKPLNRCYLQSIRTLPASESPAPPVPRSAVNTPPEEVLSGHESQALIGDRGWTLREVVTHPQRASKQPHLLRSPPPTVKSCPPT